MDEGVTPKGKLNASDDGLQISISAQGRLVRLVFSSPVKAIALDPETAKALGFRLIRRGRLAERADR